MDSSSRLMSRSAERDAPTELSCSSRCMRSSEALTGGSRGGELLKRLLIEAALLDTNGPHFLHVRHSHQAFLHPVLLEGAHSVVERLGEHFSDSRMLLDQLLQPVGGDQQRVQAATALESGIAALVAARGLVESKLPLVAAVGPDPVLVDRFHG